MLRILFFNALPFVVVLIVGFENVSKLLRFV